MKKLAFLLALLLFAGLSLCYTQITITYGDMQTAFVVGTQYTLVGDSSHTVTNVGTASSTAQTWDFRSRPYFLQGSGASIVPSTAPHITEFSGTNVVLYSTTVIPPSDTIFGYSYYTLQTSGLDFLGIGTDASFTRYSPAVPWMHLPCTMGTNWTYQSDTIWIVSPYAWVVNTNTYNVDAFGTLRLPTGDYQALRLKNTQITFSGIFGNITQAKSITYTFQTSTLVSAMVSVESAQDNLADVNPSYIIYTGLGSNDVRPLTGTIPERFALGQNYPNPFNPTTSIIYELPALNRVTLKVYDLLGRETATLVDDVKHAGRYTTTWNAGDVATGAYFYRLQAGDFVQTRKLLIVR